jgi:hypothetical protein
MSRLCFAFIVLLMAPADLTVALGPGIQGKVSQSPRIEPKPTNCETHIAILDIADQDAGQNGLIIMIGRLGDGERSRELNQHRLHSARTYLTEYRRVHSPSTIVIAEGERVSGFGRIECTLAVNCTPPSQLDVMLIYPLALVNLQSSMIQG